MREAKPEASPVVHLIRFKEKRVRAQSNHRKRNERYLRDSARWCYVVHVYLLPRLAEPGKTETRSNAAPGSSLRHKKTKPYLFEYGLVSCFSRALAMSRISFRELSKQAQSLLNRLWISFVLTKALLKRDRIKIEVQRYPREAKWPLRRNFSKQPLTSTSNNVTLTVGCPKSVANGSCQNRCQKISFRFYRRGCFCIFFGQKLVSRIAHRLLKSPMIYASYGIRGFEKELLDKELFFEKVGTERTSLEVLVRLRT